MSDVIIETINEKHDEPALDEQPKQAAPQAPPAAPSTFNIKAIPQKKICELTDDEKKALYEASLRNEYNDYYEVKHHANGKYRIVHRKPKTSSQSSRPSIAQQAISGNGELTINTDAHDKSKQSKVYMSDNQLVWMHLLDLEQKYERLYNKHKKLKRKYNDLYIEDVDEDAYVQPKQPQHEETPSPQQQQEQHEDEPQEQPTYSQSTVTYAQPITNWRSALMRKHFN